MAESHPSRLVIIVAIVTVLAVIAAVGFWQLSPVEHLTQGVYSETFLVDCDFNKYRQIMVRKNATKAIVGNSGMELLEEQIQDLDLDTSGDDRPLLNAILGKSKTELSAVRLLTVSLNDPHLEADQLSLKQHADVKPERMHVRTESIKPAGRLESYKTELVAVPTDEVASDQGSSDQDLSHRGTEVTLSVQMQVRLRVPKLFTGRADAEVKQAAVDTISEQQASIKQFVAEHADARLILPELFSK